MSILRRVLGRGDPFDPLERAVLRELLLRLPPPASELVERQLAAINLVQRHAAGKEVNLYRMVHGGSSPPHEAALPRGDPEAELARLQFVPIGHERLMTASFWIVRGVLFSIQFDASPTPILREREILVKAFELCIDPLVAPADAPPRWLVRPTSVSWAALCQDYGPCYGTAPLSESECVSRLAGLQVAVPDDYLTLLAETDGLGTERFHVRGCRELSPLAMPNATFVVLAEVAPIGEIAVKQLNVDAVLYSFSYGRNDVRPAGRSLAQAIGQLLREKATTA